MKFTTTLVDSSILTLISAPPLPLTGKKVRLQIGEASLEISAGLLEGGGKQYYIPRAKGGSQAIHSFIQKGCEQLGRPVPAPRKGVPGVEMTVEVVEE